MPRFKELICSTLMSTMFLSSLFLTSCKEDVEYHYNLTTSGTIYFNGEQTISLIPSEYNEYATTFLSTISKDDITFGGTLVGKNLKEVEYVSDKEVKLSVDGKVTADSSKSKEFGTIKVSHKALKNNADGIATFYVNFEPELTTEGVTIGTIGKKKNYSSKLKLPFGSFIEENVNTTNITVPLDDVTVDVKYISTTEIDIQVNNFEEFEYEGKTYEFPVAKLGANVTSFNKDLYIEIGKPGASALLY